MIETDRLLLREYAMEDFDALYKIVSDPETMQHYPAPYTPENAETGSPGIWKTTAITASASGRWC